MENSENSRGNAGHVSGKEGATLLKMIDFSFFDCDY
jgi:hypothetical protein